VAPGEAAGQAKVATAIRAAISRSNKRGLDVFVEIPRAVVKEFALIRLDPIGDLKAAGAPYRLATASDVLIVVTRVWQAWLEPVETVAMGDQPLGKILKRTIHITKQ
jgi:hypothetical protein